MTSDHRSLLETLFRAAIAAADPLVLVPQHLPRPGTGRTIVIGAGKAAASMAQAVERHWQGEISGLVITRYGHGLPCERIEVVEAAHPIPDAAGLAATQRLFALVQNLRPEDQVICLISGGGSALLNLPAPGVTLADKQLINAALLKSGATISEINCVRKHLSAVKGGRLALACAPAQVTSLVISDVPGDDLSVIASGPMSGDASTVQQARAILQRYQINLPASVEAYLASGLAETPKPDDPRLAHCKTILIASAHGSLEAAARLARQSGYHPLNLGDFIEGESREVAYVHAALARQIALRNEPLARPCVILSGGETSVRVTGSGRGGRNSEFLLALAQALNGHASIHAFAGDTDGIDGSEDNAGCFIDPHTLARAESLGLKATDYLARNDAYSYFAALNDLLVTGPSHTNVNDFRAILID
jgi:hydroxypyruvate reductase